MWSQYCEISTTLWPHNICFTCMLTVLWKLTTWWTMLSQYRTILWVFHNIMNNIVNILWQYWGGKCEGWWWRLSVWISWCDSRVWPRVFLSWNNCCYPIWFFYLIMGFGFVMHHHAITIPAFASRCCLYSILHFQLYMVLSWINLPFTLALYCVY